MGMTWADLGDSGIPMQILRVWIIAGCILGIGGLVVWLNHPPWDK